jgi:hypothetical protein
VHASIILQLPAAASSAVPPQHSEAAAVRLVPSPERTVESAAPVGSSVRRIAFVAAPRNPLPSQYVSEKGLVLKLRGGGNGEDDAADESDDVDDESDQEVSDEEEEEDEAVVETGESEAPPAKDDLDAALSASAVRSAIKTKVKREIAKKQAAKRAVNAELKTSKPAVESKKKVKKSASSASASFFRIPYVVRAFLNPVTVFKMTIAYWASLFDLDYLKKKEAPSQDLRSALQEKARYEPSKKKGSGGPRKQMKRGQAKTLSDLPQLSS